MVRLGQLTVWVLVTCHHVINVNADRNVPVSLLNKAIDRPKLQTYDKTTLHVCADKCVYSTDCMSITFNFDTGNCALYFVNSSKAEADDDLKDEKNAVVVDVINWIQDKTGGCWDRPCPSNSYCIPGKQELFCKRLVRCPAVVPPENGEVDPPDKSYFEIGENIGLGCKKPYLSTLLNPHAKWSFSCLPDGTFPDWSYYCYTIQQLCTHYTIEKYLNETSVTVSVHNPLSDQWQADDVLFSSAGGLAFMDSNDAYVQIKFGTEKLIGGVAIKGGPDSKWVTSFTVKHSQRSDCSTFIDVKDSNGNVMNFTGNVDMDSIVTSYFWLPIDVTCLRLYPTASNNEPALRLEYLECKAP